MLDTIKNINNNYYENNNLFKLKYDLASYFRNSSEKASETSVTLLAYLLIEAKKYNNPIGVSLNEIKSNADNRLISMINEYIPESVWEKAISDIHSYDIKDLLSIIFSQDDTRQFTEDSTPVSLCNLGSAALDIKDKDHVLDICCGIGNFITNSYINHSDSVYYGCDTNTELIAIAYIKSLALSGNVNILQNNCFNLISDNLKFDKIFGNYPFGVKRKMYTYFDEYLENKIKSVMAFEKASSDWIFNSLMIDLLKDNGKAIAIMPDNGLYNIPDRDIRQYFVDNSYIEAIVALPKNIFPYTGIKTNLIILSKTNKKGIRFVDATNEFDKGRRINTLSNENINNIIEMLSCESDNSKFISYEEIKNNDYSLNEKNYLNIKLEFKNGRQFGEVIKSITRGAPLNAKELDKLNSNEPTEYQYLMLANIQDGVIDNVLPYITEIDEKYYKYCIKNNDLLLSKFGAPGSPFKVAVAEIVDNKKILANGNLYIIEVDQEVANPIYLKALFESEIGSSLLSSISVGAHMPSISVGDLKKLIIPLPTLEEQTLVAEEYAALEDEIKLLNLKIEKAKEKKKSVFTI